MSSRMQTYPPQLKHMFNPGGGEDEDEDEDEKPRR